MDNVVGYFIIRNIQDKHDALTYAIIGTIQHK